LKEEHATLIRHMQEKAYEINKRIVKSDPTVHFRTGFHAVPSMKQVWAGVGRLKIIVVVHPCRRSTCI
jgi:hypothetical protein